MTIAERTQDNPEFTAVLKQKIQILIDTARRCQVDPNQQNVQRPPGGAVAQPKA